jgi:hypothetical protein
MWDIVSSLEGWHRCCAIEPREDAGVWVLIPNFSKDLLDGVDQDLECVVWIGGREVDPNVIAKVKRGASIGPRRGRGPGIRGILERLRVRWVS